MKFNQEYFSERNKKSRGFSESVRQTPLTSMDIIDHRHWIEEAYKGMLREACVPDDCCQRFERTFKNYDMFLIWSTRNE